MMTRFAILFAVLGLAAGPAHAEKLPTAVDLLFNAKHVEAVKKGEELKYEFKRQVSKSKFGTPSFEDEINVEITNETPEKTKNMKLKVFTGDRARSAFETPGMSGNPILIWYLDRYVASYNQVAGGAVMYLKGKVRKALGEEAKVEATKVTVDGKEADGYKITVTPFTKDPAKTRMNGYENSSLEFIVSESVPGYFHSMKSNYFSTGKDTPKIVEAVAFKTVEVAK